MANALWRRARRARAGRCSTSTSTSRCHAWPAMSSSPSTPAAAAASRGYRPRVSYLTFISGMVLHRCWPDRGDVAFVVSAYLDLLLLFYCLRRYERAEPGSSLREWLKLAVWLLTSALTLLFSYMVAAVMPAAVAAVVCLMGLATIPGGFLAFFWFQKKT